MNKPFPTNLMVEYNNLYIEKDIKILSVQNILEISSNHVNLYKASLPSASLARLYFFSALTSPSLNFHYSTVTVLLCLLVYPRPDTVSPYGRICFLIFLFLGFHTALHMVAIQ